jgi:hypothetical protein
MSTMKRPFSTELLRNLKVLRYYVPDKLFAESNLPQVRIFLSLSGSCEAGNKVKYIASEDLSVAFSSAGYLPGKQTFRTDYGAFGVIIPLNNNYIYIKHKDLVTKIDNYYQCKLKSPPSTISLPDELVYVANNILETKLIKLCTDTESINVIRPMIKADCYNCVFLPGETKAHIPATRLFNGVDYFYVYLSSSNSYSRHFIYLESRQYNPVDEFDIPDLVELRMFNNVLAHHFVYAVDVDARINGYYCAPSVQQCKTEKAELQDRCVKVPHTPKENKRKTKTKTRRLQFVKVFVDDKMEQNRVVPVAVGYSIVNTSNLEVSAKEKFNEASLAIYQATLKQSVKDRISLSLLYKNLSINTSIINFVKHILSHDLVISYYFSKIGFVKVEQFIKYVFLLNDLFLHRFTIDIVAQSNTPEVVKRILEGLENGLNNLRTDKVLLLRDLVFTTRGNTLGIFTGKKTTKLEIDRNEISRRLHNLLEKQKQVSGKVLKNGDWRHGVLLDLIRHTYSHHLIKVISQGAKVDSTKLIEVYVEGERQPVLIIERERGGLGILQGTMEEYKRDAYRAYRDLIISFGKCLVGTPEDVLHFMLADSDFRKRLCDAKSHELARVIEEFVRDHMELLLLPEELAETVRLWHSIRMEAQRLIELLPQEKLRNAVQPECALLKEIHESRDQLERTIYRYPELDELIVYLLLNMKKGQVLRSLVEELLERSLNIAGKSSYLQQLYDNRNNYIELFLNDVKSVLENGCASHGAAPRICASIRNRKYFDDDVVYSVKALGRIMRGVLLRLALLTCNSACGHCYVNTRSCSRFSAPFIQARTLDRRVAKIVASEFVKLKFNGIQDIYSSDFEPDIVVRLKKGHYSKVNLKAS